VLVAGQGPGEDRLAPPLAQSSPPGMERPREETQRRERAKKQQEAQAREPRRVRTWDDGSESLTLLPSFFLFLSFFFLKFIFPLSLPVI